LGRYLGDWQERRCQNRASEMPWFRQSDFPPFAGHTKLATDQFPIREKGHRSLFGSSAFPGDENPAALFLGSYPALRSRSATTSISARSLALTWNSLFLLAHLPRSFSSFSATNRLCLRWPSGVHSTNSNCATSTGWSQRHSFIFSAVRPCPQRPPHGSGRLEKGHSWISSGWNRRYSSVREAGVNPLRVLAA